MAIADGRVENGEKTMRERLEDGSLPPAPS